MDKNDYYKKKDHKVTIKRYGLLNWYGYNMENYLWFKTVVYIASYLIGMIIGLLLANKL